ncbi:MAG: hypothetical protein E6Q76_07470 [Rhizobium sp.]|nr:MAG: hypothetical protein E6Q76_07470 [Rhizobium sp.]
MLRGTTLSCVTDAGGVIEVSLKAYAVGEDGKVGLRGRLINKQSSLIARAMLAGFMQSFSELFKKNPVPVIASTATDTTQFQSVLSSASLQGAAAQGASSAMQRLAQYYIDLADAIHPVIEVDAGRTVDLVISTGIGFAALSNS